jgi:hypothetical protein
MDLVGKKFNHLTVMSYSHKSRGQSYWLCECDCENKNQVVVYQGSMISGHTKSCGCARIINISGQRFGRLTAIKLSHVVGGGAHWLCKCDCGNESVVRLNNLKHSTKSCGCLYHEVNDILGQKFGILVAKKFLYTRGRRAYWLCECKCGNEKIVPQNRLQSGNTKSCGCCLLTSESSLFDAIKDVIGEKYDIKRHYYIECISPQNVDGAIFNGDRLVCCVEYDGEQHFMPIVSFGGEERFQYQKKLDKKKNKILKNNHIALIRFSYKEKKQFTKEYIVEKLRKAGIEMPEMTND